MYRASFAPLIVSLLIFAPLTASAQNICIAANAECEHPGLACACPVTVLGAVIATIAGVCIAPDECQETAIIPTPTIATLLVGGGLAAGTIFSTLMSGSGGSEGSSESFNGGLATADLVQSDVSSGNTSIYSSTASSHTADNAKFDALIAGVGQAQSTTPIDFTAYISVPCGLPSSRQSTGSADADALQAAIATPCSQTI